MTSASVDGSCLDRDGGNRVGLAGAVAALVALATVLQVAREAAVSAWDTVWAEDGSVFLADALNHSFFSTLFEPHGGYLHVVPRLIAELAAILPLELAAPTFNVVSALIVSLLAAFAYVASGSKLQARSSRLALSMLVALLPAAGSELLGNAANLHFYLIFACFWAFLWRSETRGALGARVAVVVATTLSDPLAVLLAPLAVADVFGRRSRRALVVPGAFVLGLALQLAAIAASESPERLTRFDPADLVPLFALRVAASLAVGDRFIDDFWFAYGRGFSYGVLVLVAAALVAGMARSPRRTRLFAAVCVAYSVLFFIVFLVGRGSAGMRPGTDEATWHLAGARFTYAPILFLATAFLAMLDARVRTVAGARRALLSTVVVGAVTVLVAANFSFRSERSLGPTWSSELSAARDACAGREPQVRLRVAPAPFGFGLTVACKRVAAAQRLHDGGSSASLASAAAPSRPISRLTARTW